MFRVAHSFLLQAHRLEFVAICLIGFVLLGACSHPLGSGRSSTGGTSGSGGLVGGGSGGAGTGGAVGSGGTWGGTPDGSIEPDASTCENFQNTARAQFQAYLDSTSAQACQVDADCTLLGLQSLNCIAPCGQLVGIIDTAAVTAAASAVCDAYFGAGCPEMALSCAAPRLVCAGGRCGYATPGGPDAASDAAMETDGAADSSRDVGAESACSSPSVGAACAPDETPCATCCTDHWTCADGVWKNQFLGCLPTGFSCGDQSCSEGASYCDIVPGVEAGELPYPAVYTCKTLPSSCYGQRCPTCDCLTQAGIAFYSCSADALGDVFVTH